MLSLIIMNVTGSGYERDEELARIEIATLLIMFLTSMVGNGGVVIALIAKKKWPKTAKYPRMFFFMLHLCVADMVTAWFNILPQLFWEVTYRFKGGAFLCKVVKFGQTLGPYLSSYVLMATALDRYQAVCHPLTYCSWSSRRAMIMVCIAWALALLFCIPQLVIFSYREISHGVFDCWAVFPEPYGERIYVTWYSISVFLVPLFALVYTYYCICRSLWGNSGYPITLVSPHQLVSRAKMNTVKQTIAVIAVYIACSTPFISAQLWASWDPQAYNSPFFEGATFTILTLLSSLNSCMNPWIYLIWNKDLLVALWKITYCSGGYFDRDGFGESCGSASSCGHRRFPNIITDSTLLQEQAHNHIPVARWVANIPPNATDKERKGLRLFSRARARLYNRSFENPCRAARMKPDI